MNNKIHLIYIMTFSPKFGYLEGNNSLNRAAHVWTNSKGQKIGIWREDWAFQLGEKVVKHSDDIIFSGKN